MHQKNKCDSKTRLSKISSWPVSLFFVKKEKSDWTLKS